MQSDIQKHPAVPVIVYNKESNFTALDNIVNHLVQLIIISAGILLLSGSESSVVQQTVNFGAILMAFRTIGNIISDFIRKNKIHYDPAVVDILFTSSGVFLAVAYLIGKDTK